MARRKAQAKGTRPRIGSTVDPDEVARFAALADGWWRADGDFRALHKLNPARIGYIRDRAIAHFTREKSSLAPLAGLRLLDVGCGGGLLSEPMTRLGALVTGIDAAEQCIAAARHHAAGMELDIDYRCTTAEALEGEVAPYDIVLAMEIVEHVADLGAFARAAAALVAPGGLLIAATLNRTLKSCALAFVGAEYLLIWVPRGTHDWRKFPRPSELARALRRAGLDVIDIAGFAYDPVRDAWHVGRDLGVNYGLTAIRPE